MAFQEIQRALLCSFHVAAEQLRSLTCYFEGGTEYRKKNPVPFLLLQNWVDFVKRWNLRRQKWVCLLAIKPETTKDASSICSFIWNIAFLDSCNLKTLCARANILLYYGVSSQCDNLNLASAMRLCWGGVSTRRRGWGDGLHRPACKGIDPLM